MEENKEFKPELTPEQNRLAKEFFEKNLKLRMVRYQRSTDGKKGFITKLMRFKKICLESKNYSKTNGK